MRNIYTFAKFLGSLIFLYYLGFFYGFFLCIATYWLQIYVICFLYKVKKLNILDAACLYDNQKNRCYIIGNFFLEKLTFEDIKNQFREKTLIPFPKFRHKLVFIFGNPFWKEISLEEAMIRVIDCSNENIHSKEDLEKFNSKCLMELLPKDGLQWIAYVFPNYSNEESLVVWKIQHAMYDGIGGQLFFCALNDTFDPETLPFIREVSLLEQIFMHLTILYYLPISAYNNFLQPNISNPLKTDLNLNGNKIMTMSDKIPVDKIKPFAKKFGITVNDYMMTILSQSIYEYFKRRNDFSKSIILGIPISVRFHKPRNVSEIKLENKFSFAKIKIPICEKFEDGLTQIVKILKKVKNSYEYIANEISGKTMFMILPEPIWRIMQRIFTSNTTMNFSNVMGPIKPIYWNGKKQFLLYCMGIVYNKILFPAPSKKFLSLEQNIFTIIEKIPCIFVKYLYGNYPKKLLIVFHGNGEDIFSTYTCYALEISQRIESDLLIIEYPTYSKYTSNSVSLEKICSDTIKVINYIKNTEGYYEENIILCGRSLGSGIAVTISTHFNINSLILISPYSSIINIAKRHCFCLKCFCCGCLVGGKKNNIQSEKLIEKIKNKTPILIIHGKKDKIISVKEGEKLFNLIENFNNYHEFVGIENGNHNNLFIPIFFDYIERWYRNYGIIHFKENGEFLNKIDFSSFQDFYLNEIFIFQKNEENEESYEKLEKKKLININISSNYNNVYFENGILFNCIRSVFYERISLGCLLTKDFLYYIDFDTNFSKLKIKYKKLKEINKIHLDDKSLTFEKLVEIVNDSRVNNKTLDELISIIKNNLKKIEF